jgi:hypothetical protein
MACYSKSCKEMSAKVVLGLSVGIMIMGLVSLIMGATMMETWETDSYKFGSVDLSGLQAGNYFGGLALACGGLAVIVGICGILAAKKKKVYFTCPFCTLATIIGFVLLLVGVFTMFVVAVFNAMGSSDIICS